MKNYFIINPAAGSGKKIRALKERIEAACRKKGSEFEIYLTKKVGDATEFVKSKCKGAAEKLRFYACGGDGTASEVAAGAAEYENAAVGVIPAGTGNDFLRCFNGRESFSDIEAQLDASEKRIDLISCNKKYIMNMLNTGFDCEVAARAAILKRNAFVGPSMAYIMGVVGKLITKPGVKLRVSIDGGEYESKELLLATFSNGRYCGGGFRSSPRARLADGIIDVCFIKNISRTKFLSIVSKYRSGEYLDMERVKSICEYRRAKQLRIEFDEPQNICIDGEISKTRAVDLKILPQKLTVLLPFGASFNEEESGRELLKV